MSALSLTVAEVRHAPDGETLGQRFRAAVKAAKEVGDIHLEAQLIQARDAREAELKGKRPAGLARELKDLARAERKEMIDALVVVARDRAHTIGLDESLRAALDTAYDVGRMAVTLEIFKRTLDGEVRRVGGTVQ
jgi:hypothetical protein